MRGDGGFSLLSILAVLLIAGFGYYWWRGSGADRLAAEVSVPGASRTASCRISRRELERTILTWSLSHPNSPVTFQALRSARFEIPGCPGGGQWLLRKDKIECTLHSEPEARPGP